MNAKCNIKEIKLKQIKIKKMHIHFILYRKMIMIILQTDGRLARAAAKFANRAEVADAGSP